MKVRRCRTRWEDGEEGEVPGGREVWGGWIRVGGGGGGGVGEISSCKESFG